jgi:hypothetical protein
MRHCNHCEQQIAQSPVAPIIASIRDLDIGSDSTEVSFCCRQCAAIWFNAIAGEILMPDLDHAFFGPNGPTRKWPR